MPTIKSRCQYCFATYTVDQAFTGRPFQCSSPKCGKTFKATPHAAPTEPEEHFAEAGEHLDADGIRSPHTQSRNSRRDQWPERSTGQARHASAISHLVTARKMFSRHRSARSTNRSEPVIRHDWTPLELGRHGLAPVRRVSPNVRTAEQRSGRALRRFRSPSCRSPQLGAIRAPTGTSLGRGGLLYRWRTLLGCQWYPSNTQRVTHIDRVERRLDALPDVPAVPRSSRSTDRVQLHQANVTVAATNVRPTRHPLADLRSGHAAYRLAVVRRRTARGRPHARHADDLAGRARVLGFSATSRLDRKDGPAAPCCPRDARQDGLGMIGVASPLPDPSQTSKTTISTQTSRPDSARAPTRPLLVLVLVFCLCLCLCLCGLLTPK